MKYSTITRLHSCSITQRTHSTVHAVHFEAQLCLYPRQKSDTIVKAKVSQPTSGLYLPGVGCFSLLNKKPPRPKLARTEEIPQCSFRC